MATENSERRAAARFENPAVPHALFHDYDRLCFRERDLMRDGQAKHVAEIEDVQRKRMDLRYRILALQPTDVASAAARYDREEQALADALFVLGHTTKMIAPDVASDIIGYMRNKHDVILKREEWLCDPDAASAAAGVTISGDDARIAARACRYEGNKLETGGMSGTDWFDVAERIELAAAESAEANGEGSGA